jgi:hypothetical protein
MKHQWSSLGVQRDQKHVFLFEPVGDSPEGPLKNRGNLA